MKSPVKLPKAFTQLGKVPMSAKWWLSLGDPHVTRWIQMGLQGNLDLRGARARLQQRWALLRRTGADRFPTLSGRGNATIGANKFGPINQFLVGIVASYELDVWGRIRSAVAASKLDVLASREDVKAAAISLTGEVAVSWYRYVERLGQAALLRSQIKTNQQSLDLLTARFRLGQTQAADVLQQRQLLEAGRGELGQVKVQGQLLAHQLAVLLGRAPGQLKLSKVEAFGALPGLPATGLPLALIQRRPDVRSAHLAVLAAHRRVGVAIANQFPQLTLAANANVSANLNGSQIINNSQQYIGNWLANLVAGLVGPIFDGGARRAEVARTKAVVKESLQSYGTAILRALREVEDALAQERAQHKLLASQRKQLALGQQVIQRIRFRYLNGAESFLRVLTAVRSFQTLQRSHLTAQRDLWLARVALCRALAGGWKGLVAAKGQK